MRESGDAGMEVDGDDVGRAAELVSNDDRTLFLLAGDDPRDNVGFSASGLLEFNNR